jgi:prophage regulatory protein
MTHTQEHEAKPRFLRIDQVEDLTAISRSHIYHLASQGQFPRQVNLFGRSVRWLESEVLDWMSHRLANRRINGEAA